MAAALCVLIMRSRYVRAAAIGVLASWLLVFKDYCARARVRLAGWSEFHLWWSRACGWFWRVKA